MKCVFLVACTFKLCYRISMGIGFRLRKTIRERGLKQKWIAGQLEMSENNFQRILDDKVSLNAKNLMRLAVVLGVSTDFILGLKDEAS
jgi:plasmid maintenance system antidote protein VapI